MKAGQLRDRITLQRRKPGGSLGQPSNTWEDVATVWANIRFGTGAEAIRSGQVASTAKVSIRIRWRVGTTAEMRAVCAAGAHAGMVFEIVSVLPDFQKREHVDLVCEVTG